MFLPYRALAHSAGHPIAVAAHQFLRYRGVVRSAHPLRGGKSAVFLPYRFARVLVAHRYAAWTDFLPYRIAEKQVKPDVLLLAVRLLCSEPAQRCCAAASFLYAQTASDLFLHCRQAVPGFGVWQT